MVVIYPECISFWWMMKNCRRGCRAFEGTRKTRNSAVTSQKPHRTRVFCGRFPRHVFKKYLRIWLYYRYLSASNVSNAFRSSHICLSSRRRKRKLRKHTNVYGNTRARPKMSERTRSLPSRSHVRSRFSEVRQRGGDVWIDLSYEWVDICILVTVLLKNYLQVQQSSIMSERKRKLLPSKAPVFIFL